MSGTRESGRRHPARAGTRKQDTLALAAEPHSAVVLIDERDGRRDARRRGWPVMGTLGLLRAATDRRFEGLNLAEALARLRRTNSRASHAVFAEVTWTAASPAPCRTLGSGRPPREGDG